MSAWGKATHNKSYNDFVKSETWLAKLANVIDFGGAKEIFQEPLTLKYFFKFKFSKSNNLPIILRKYTTS